MKAKVVEHIPKKKLEEVESLKDLIKNKKTILITSIKNIPGSQFQEIGKKLRGKAIVKVPKKSLIFRAIDTSKNETLKQLKDQIENSVAILFSDLDCFSLAAELVKNKSPSKAKPGQEAPEDIEIQAGPTDLVPGPAISELGALGIQIQIEKGKIHIKKPRVIAKQGQKISQNAADIMAKLDIKPFSIGFIPLAGFDIEAARLYLDIKINPEEALNELKQDYNKALALSVEIGYANKDTITFLIGKASNYEKALDSLALKKTEKEEVKENIQTPEETKSEGEGK